MTRPYLGSVGGCPVHPYPDLPLTDPLPLTDDGVTKKEVDHILTRSRDKSLFLSCRARRGAEAPANTDHVLVISEMRIAPYKPRNLQAPLKKFDT